MKIVSFKGEKCANIFFIPAEIRPFIANALVFVVMSDAVLSTKNSLMTISESKKDKFSNVCSLNMKSKGF